MHRFSAILSISALYANILFCIFAISSFFIFSCRVERAARILVFTKTEGYRHASIPAGVAALRGICRQQGWVMDSTEDAADFSEVNLKRYHAVIFLNTTGDVLEPRQENAFERYIQAGGGYVGIHSATDTEYGWRWYGGLSGAYFRGHPEIQDARIRVEDRLHASTQHLSDSVWCRRDEWYNFKEVNTGVKVLLSLDEVSYSGGDMCGRLEGGRCHPLAWSQVYDGGRAFYTGMGHTDASYREPAFLDHLAGGIRYVLRRGRLDYSKCSTRLMPDPTRFQKTVMATDLTEPMEFDMLPDGKIIFIERRGMIKLFNPETGLVSIAHKLPVHAEFEDGLMGLELDPRYEENHWVYLYYSPVGDKSVNHLSRFNFVGDTLDRGSEKVLLRVDVQRVECCHAGGCIEFDGQGNLFLSTGDNTNPFASDGYAPIDERPGRSPWDAQKSSGNTMDLRGKILRITPQADGTYTIPAGNLFPDARVGRPEIYVMGCRNPFRISYDSRREYLFWGEVGPDAGESDTARGPAGHDEVNRARQAGFFGWPYFVADNKAYRDYDFQAARSGPWFDPQHPINDSPNNTGARELPPAQPAFIWYPYGNSTEFPLTRNGGRNAMAGPVYYRDIYRGAHRLPDYYDGKLITYDWARSWMMAITLDSLGNFSRMEPFADSLSFSRPMDMFLDKQGSLWVLEYGTQWFAKNPDARISRIDYYRGNRPPRPVLEAAPQAGAAPLEVVFSGSGTVDNDGGILRCCIEFGDGSRPVKFKTRGLPTERPRRRVAAAQSAPVVYPQTGIDCIRHTYHREGTYQVVLSVTDDLGIERKATRTVQVGNSPPQVVWDFKGGNRSFYSWGDSVQYAVSVLDIEDGVIHPGAIAARIDYLETGFDMTNIARGHQISKKAAENSRGRALIDAADCKVCHAEDRKVNGPTYREIAQRYRGDEFALNTLTRKVIKGGSGVWGAKAMSAHPQLSSDQASEMIRYILSLADSEREETKLALNGLFRFDGPVGVGKPPGTYLFQASYTDRGKATLPALSFQDVVVLRPAFQQAERADSMSGNLRTYQPYGGDTVVVNEFRHRNFIMFRRCDLRGVHSIAVGVGLGDQRYPCRGGVLEVRLDRPDGDMVGQVVVPEGRNRYPMVMEYLRIPILFVDDGNYHDIYLVFKKPQNPSEWIAALDWVRFDLRD